ncbi:MAG: hypothetical protein Q9195_003718 [Heterodermia aff. obscurata]
MRSHLSHAALLALTLLLSNTTVHARRGLDPEDLYLLTRGTDYTFHSICADYKNPDLFFDEWELSRAITAITNDLNMYMSGFSSSSTPDSPILNAPHTLPVPLKNQAGGRWDRDVRPAAGAREKEKEKEKETEKGGRRRNIDCKKFQRDLRDNPDGSSRRVFRKCPTPSPRSVIANAKPMATSLTPLPLYSESLNRIIMG